MAMTGGTAKLVKTSTTAVGTKVNLYVYYKVSQSIANNSSTISCGMYFEVTGGGTIGPWKDNGSYVGTDSNEFTTNVLEKVSKQWLAENKTFTIVHDKVTGKGTATIKWSWGVNSSWGGMVYPSGSFTITLPTIPRNSSVKATNAYIGNKPTITISRASSSLTHTLQYKIAGQSSYTTIVSKTTSTQYSSWAIPEKAYNYISSGKVSITIKCITYSGTTKIGESTTTLTATAKAASTIKATNANIEEISTISITRKSSSFKHKLYYKIQGQAEYTAIATTTATTYKWTIKSDFYKVIKNASKAAVNIKCETYYDTKKIGEDVITITVYCLESKCKPKIENFLIQDNLSSSFKLTQDHEIIIKGFNTMEFSASVTLQHEATIKNCELICLDKKATGTINGSSISGTIENVNSNKFVLKVTDSRGFSSEEIKTLKIIDYFKPSGVLTGNGFITETETETGTTDSDTNETTKTATLNINLSGSWFNGDFKEKEISNELELTYQIDNRKPVTVDKFEILDNKYSFQITESNLAYQESYKVTIKLEDGIKLIGEDQTNFSTLQITKTISIVPIFYWNNESFNFNVPINAMSNKYYAPLQEDKGTGGLHMHNSDIVGANGIFFGDTANLDGEGLFFPTGTNSYDVLYARAGKLYFKPEYSKNKTAYAYKMCITPNDTISFSKHTPFSGYVSNARKTIFFSIPINKPLVNVTKVTLSGSIQLRGIGGYLCSPTTKSSIVDLTVSDDKIVYDSTEKENTATSDTEKVTITTSLQGSLIHVHITFQNDLINAGPSNTTASSDDPVITNNTPICIVPYGTLTATFAFE